MGPGLTLESGEFIPAEELNKMMNAKSKCAQCGKGYSPTTGAVGCPKCAPGVKVDEVEFRQPLGAQQPAPSAAATDPMDWPLPCDVTVGHGTMRKGVSLRTLVTRMKVLYEMATGNNADEVANRAPEENTALADAFRAKVGAAPQPSPTPQADSQPAPVRDEPTWTVFNSGAQVAEVESLDEALAYLTPERLSRQWCAVCVVDQSNLPQSRAARAPADSVLEDAARYRWLADMNDWYAEPRLDEADGTKWQLTFYSPQCIEDAMADDSLDVAVDAALARLGEKT